MAREEVLAWKSNLEKEFFEAMEKAPYDLKARYEVDRLAELVDVDARDLLGRTPLHVASGEGYVGICKLLLKRGADVNARNSIGETPLHYAAERGHADVARVLIEHGAEVNARDNRGQTPLHKAAKEGICALVKLLLENGANPSIRDNEGKTALDLAKTWERKEVAKIIEEFMSKLESMVSSRKEIKEEEGGTTLLVVPFDLRENERAEFTLGRIGFGDILRIKITAHPFNIYEVTLYPLEGKTLLLSTRVKGETILTYKSPTSCDVAVSVKCMEMWVSKGTLTVSLIQTSANVSKCPRCGMPLEPGAKYCGYCGAKVTE
jgi:hypothetical protein